jgi:hypothetical protein
MIDLGETGANKKYYPRRNEMKTLAYVLIGFVSIFCLAGMICSKAEATPPDYWGEYCWSFLQTEDELGPYVVGPFVMRMGVTYMGGAYFTLQGLINEAPDPDPVIIGGSATIVGNKVFMTLNNTQDDTTTLWRYSGTFQVQLDISTLNGTWWSNFVSFNTDTLDVGIEYGAGTLTFTTCP